MEYQKVHCLLDALRATVMISSTFLKETVTVEQSVWTEEELNKIKTELLNQLLTPTKTTNEQ